MEDHKVRESNKEEKITPGMSVRYMKYVDHDKYCINAGVNTGLAPFTASKTSSG